MIDPISRFVFVVETGSLQFQRAGQSATIPERDCPGRDIRFPAVPPIKPPCTPGQGYHCIRDPGVGSTSPRSRCLLEQVSCRRRSRGSA